jgi:hypothetical protein
MKKVTPKKAPLNKEAKKQRLLSLAQHGLEIDGVLVRGLRVLMDSNLEPGVNAEDKEYIVQHGTELKGCKHVEIDGKSYLLVRYGLGVRFLNSSSNSGESPKEKKKSSKNSPVVIKIEALYTARYLISNADISKDAINIFARTNAPFNVWPFWRELVHSATQKMGMTGFTMPLYHSASK